ncbi:phage tail assembly chaperone G [Companilactobacillus ginsenosidimutans]|uniref:phage tail assembly chaperone G n=1 Tax=Companilactobacillus ginsenosidimutans TaxID=1007676 RepID=UPI00065FFD6F|nr:hypothetical protein [Companilactobacillus ginsenosidimutans]
MVYKIKLRIDGKLEEFKRTEPPYLKEITRALILQQHQVAMYQDDDGPTDKQFLKNSEEVADFAVNFWNNQFSRQDVLNGADGKAMTEVSKAIDDALGTPNDDEVDEGKAKK